MPTALPTNSSLNLEALAARLSILPAGRRRILAIAGAPGSGKSTLAEALQVHLNARETGCAALLPMDGFHYDDAVLIERGLRTRKGSPETFDVGGLRHMLERLKRNSEAEIAVPVFDRELEIARAGARLVPRAIRYVIVEGNYLLLLTEPWRSLRPHFDITAMLVVSESVLRRRLMERWHSQGLAPGEIETKVENNDLPNGRLVIQNSAPADLVLEEAK